MHGSATNEAVRFERLRAQDGQPLLPPPNMRPLCTGGGLNPALVGEATQQWNAALSETAQAPSFLAEERLFWTAFLLARHYAELNERRRVEPLLRPTIAQLTQQRYRQLALGLLARNQAAIGDKATATQVLPQLDAASEDLQVDTNYRFTTAYVASLVGDSARVLAVLGREIDEVPISDAYDMVCAVFRAHAHECLGDLARAQAQLERIAPSPGDIPHLEQIVRLTPQVALVPRSLPAAKIAVTQLHQNAVVTKSGINVGRLIMLPMLGSVLAIGAGSFASEALQPPLSEILPGVMIVVAVLASIAFAMSVALKGPRLRKRLMARGLEGRAKLMAVVQTNTRVNDQPVLRLRMLVQLQGQPPYAVVHNEIVPQIRLAQLQPGMHLPVRVDPTDRRMMAIAWG